MDSSSHKFPYEWKLSDGYPAKGIEKHGSTVFSCFACGGGSSLGYKLAGYDVIGVNDIDPKMMQIYIQNHHPKHTYLEDIRIFNGREDLPEELFNLDVLDGSPPCSSFSLAGSREDGWGKEKKFREGQAHQILDDLFFHFIDTVKKLQPKIVIAENVAGILIGNAKGYVIQIVQAFNDAGYDVQIFSLNAASMGVPQRRQRAFFMCSRKDLKLPKINLQFNEPPLKFGAVRSKNASPKVVGGQASIVLPMRTSSDTCMNDINQRLYGKQSGFTNSIVRDFEVCPTIVSQSVIYRGFDGGFLSDEDLIHVGTFPSDYDFCGLQLKYVIGMSVPPVMCAQVSHQVYLQWLSKVSL